MGGIARKNRMKAMSIGGVEDHVHLLLLIPSPTENRRSSRRTKSLGYYQASLRNDKPAAP
jgi:REP element-mobilizing transposase RayT